MDGVREARLRSAARFAALGDHAAAVKLLDTATTGEPVVAELDLRARIHAQQGRYAEAIETWQRALEIDPDNASASAGIARADAIRKHGERSRRVRLPLWIGAAAASPVLALALAFAAGRYGFGYAGVAELRAAQAELASEVASLRGLLEVATDGTVSRDGSMRNGGLATGAAIAGLTRASIAGVRIAAEGGAVRIDFDDGLFPSGGTHLNVRAANRLTAVATLLARVSGDVRITVTGSADARPVVDGARYRDNEALALARAAAAAEFMRENGPLPIGALAVAGSTPDATVRDPLAMPASRTVVIRVEPRMEQ
jgi:type VI secretion system protein ImpK